MQDLRDLKDEDLQGLTPEAVTALAQQMLQHIQRQAQDIRLKDAKLEKLTFELARHKAWKFGAKSEAMSAEQRRLFEETLAEDEAALQALLEQAKGTPAPDDKRLVQAQATTSASTRPSAPRAAPSRARRHRLPSPGCGKPMVRVGEDISDKLDIVPAEFFVHRHVYGKWACRCCQRLVQEAVEPQLIDGGMPEARLVAHTLISRFVDHLPYYRQEAINARSGVHTPRSTLAAAWSGRGGAALEPLYDAHKRFVLSSPVLHADETPVALLDPGRSKTRKAYVWAYARGAFDPVPGVIYDFCVGRGAQFPIAFLGTTQGDQDERSWRGTLVRDEYKAYDSVMSAEPGRTAAGCLAHARRKFDELLLDSGQERRRRGGAASYRGDLSPRARTIDAWHAMSGCREDAAMRGRYGRTTCMIGCDWSEAVCPTVAPLPRP